MSSQVAKKYNVVLVGNEVDGVNEDTESDLPVGAGIYDTNITLKGRCCGFDRRAAHILDHSKDVDLFVACGIGSSYRCQG